MKTGPVVSLTTLFLYLLLVPAIVANAQHGVSSLSMGMSRAGVFPSFGEIRIEEFINYHRHGIPTPTENERVRLSLASAPVDGNKLAFQVGLATPPNADPDKTPALNLVLVIDHSGSMSGDRIENVKKATLSMIEKFRKKDQITIVGFASEAHVILSACKKNSIKKITKAVNEIQATSSTNLHGGLMLGYQQALQNFDTEKTNRVILLTDGLANVGTTDSNKIAKDSRRFNLEGISLSTIGLGHNLNQELLRQLADSGRGLIHFIDDSKDIKKTFIREVDSLLSPAADNIKLTVDFGNCEKTPRIYGYESRKTKGKRVIFHLDDLNHSATQIVMSRIKLSNRVSEVVVTLEYRDALTKKQVKTVQKIDLSTANHDSQSESIREDVLKNHTIAKLARSIRKSIQKTEQQKIKDGLAHIKNAIHSAKKSCQDNHDKDIERMIKIAIGYRDQIDVYCKSIHDN